MVTTKDNRYILIPEVKNVTVATFKTLNEQLNLPVMFKEMSLDEALLELDSGRARAVVAGASIPSSEVIGAGIRKFNPRRNAGGELDDNGKRQLVSSFFVFEKVGHEPFILTDGAVNVDPDAGTLAELAGQTCKSAIKLGLKPCVAFLSYSTFGSGRGPSPDKVAAATKLFEKANPDIPVIGEVQFDSATDENIYKLKTGQGYPKGFTPNVFVAPNLDVGNILYKTLQSVEFGGGWTAIGPLLQGFEEGRQLHDLSRGVTPEALIKIVEYVDKLSS